MNFSNESLTTNASTPVLSSATTPQEPAVIITVAVLSIIGNILVVIVTTRRQTFPSSSRIFVSSMACSDLLLGSIFSFLVAPAAAGEWVYSDTAEKAVAVIGLSSITITSSALAGLNLDRYYALMNDGVGISGKKARIYLISAWTGTYACTNRVDVVQQNIEMGIL
ncbi:beta-3 adrenergic receptor-like [Branchiostoma floridae]|uniref:Beta-3 adrenergic receptor-like n=1 Tax=Branchiostoma floridae TaxID=7739 RepID=A0A9J7M9H7_BRAFL|nr:beta-3 adrenergic receptor-like [Branchiostoma floridae]